MKTLAHCEESLCKAYLTAVAAIARQQISWGAEHDYGVDGSFRLVASRSGRLHETGISFDFQAKTSIGWEIEGNEIKYDLEVNAFNDLVERASLPRAVPCFLILYCLPPDITNWFNHEEEKSILQRCAYYAKLEGNLTANRETKRIRIPRTNHFNATTVNTLLENVKSGVILP